MEKIIFFGLVIPIFAFVLYLGISAIMKGSEAKSALKEEANLKNEESENSLDDKKNLSEEKNDDKFLKIVKNITSKGFVRSNYEEKLVDLSDVRINLKTKN